MALHRRDAQGRYRSKQDSATLATILTWLKAGGTREAACAMAGISSFTLRRWCEHSDDLLQQVRAAEAEAEMLCSGTILQAVRQGNWSAASWWRPGPRCSKRAA
ncbi:MAG TPA: hypothetical protein VGK33_08630 [Chloroflexota bacterium]